MTRVRKIGIILVLVGICLPTATLPFITEFHPQPEICLTSNFFGNLGNMMVLFGSREVNVSGNNAEQIHDPWIVIPYRYFFSIGVVMVCTGLGIIILSSGKAPVKSK